MRVEALSQVSQMYQAAKAKKAAQKTDAREKDRYEASRSARDYQIARNAVAAAPEIREEKVEKIKEALSSGTYNVSAQEIADKMVSKYFDSLI